MLETAMSEKPSFESKNVNYVDTEIDREREKLKRAEHSNSRIHF